MGEVGGGSCWTVIVTGCLNDGETLQGPSKVIQEILVLVQHSFLLGGSI